MSIKPEHTVYHLRQSIVYFTSMGSIEMGSIEEKLLYFHHLIQRVEVCFHLHVIPIKFCNARVTN